MDEMSSLELIFDAEPDEDLKTQIALDHLVRTRQRLGSDYNINTELCYGFFLHISVKITKEKLIDDGMSE